MVDNNKVEVRTRNKRRPFNAPVSRLEITKQLDGWHYRWINDEPGRIAKALAGDYVFAEPAEVERDSSGTENRVREIAGSNKDGSTMYTYLMRIPLDFYKEDQAASREYLDGIDSAIRKGKSAQVPNSYIPEGGISIKTK